VPGVCALLAPLVCSSSVPCMHTRGAWQCSEALDVRPAHAAAVNAVQACALLRHVAVAPPAHPV
jgi:hypothetical protein